MSIETTKMEEDIELSLSPVRKSQPKQGRRAGGSSSHRDGGTSTAFLEDTNTSMSNLRSRPVSGDLFLEDNGRGQPSGGPPLHGHPPAGAGGAPSHGVAAALVQA